MSSLFSRTFALLAGWAIVGITIGATPQAPPIPAQIGTADGYVQAGATKIMLAHAYVAGPIDTDDPVYQVVLTDKPLAPDALDKELLHRGGQTLLRAGKVNGIAILVDAQGSVRNIRPFIGELRGNQMLASAGRLTGFAAKEGRATGQGSLTAAQTMNQGWSYAAAWNAAVRPPAK